MTARLKKLRKKSKSTLQEPINELHKRSMYPYLKLNIKKNANLFSKTVVLYACWKIICLLFEEICKLHSWQVYACRIRIMYYVTISHMIKKHLIRVLKACVLDCTTCWLVVCVMLSSIYVSSQLLQVILLLWSVLIWFAMRIDLVFIVHCQFTWLIFIEFYCWRRFIFLCLKQLLCLVYRIS